MANMLTRQEGGWVVICEKTVQMENYTWESGLAL